MGSGLDLPTPFCRAWAVDKVIRDEAPGPSRAENIAAGSKNCTCTIANEIHNSSVCFAPSEIGETNMVSTSKFNRISVDMSIIKIVTWNLRIFES